MDAACLSASVWGGIGGGGVCGGVSEGAAAVWDCWPGVARYSRFFKSSCKSMLFVIFPDVYILETNSNF